MKTARRSFLQAAAALVASIPFAGRLFAAPEKDKLLFRAPPANSLADAYHQANYLLVCNPVWCDRVLAAKHEIIERHVGLDAPRRIQLGGIVQDVLVYGNAFATWDELWWDQQIIQFKHSDVDLAFDPWTEETRITAPNPRLPQQRILCTRTTHFRLFNTIGGVPFKGWAFPAYFDPKQMMPTAAELVAWFNVHTAKDFQAFMAAKPW